MKRKIKVIVKRSVVCGCWMGAKWYSKAKIMYFVKRKTRFTYRIADWIESIYETFVANHTKKGKKIYSGILSNMYIHEMKSDFSEITIIINKS